MNPFAEFVQDVGGTVAAASLLGWRKSRVSRIKCGRQKLSPSDAAAVERVSHGKYDRVALLWPRDEAKAA